MSADSSGAETSTITTLAARGRVRLVRLLKWGVGSSRHNIDTGPCPVSPYRRCSYSHT